MIDLLARNWWALALRGVLALFLGAMAFLMPGITLASLVLLFGIYMVLDGVLALVGGFRAARHGERWGPLALEGVVDLIAGAIALFWPLATLIAFVYLTGFWAIVSGAILAIGAFRLAQGGARWALALSGIISVVFGVLIVAQPIAGAIALAWWIGAYAILFGITLLATAFYLRRLVPPRDARMPDGYYVSAGNKPERRR